ncbi:MAG TPA: ABC transporter ATP-binding protein [Nitrospirales bacterium]|nr:ABC transporter ATP-binding protein [Nitrospirales bacterium]
MQVVVQTENLRMEFSLGLGRGRMVALDDLTLQVESGEVFGVLGPNGSGKTTAMKVLTGLCAPTSGSAWVLGQPVGNVSVKNEIGFLPEHPYFYEYLTAEEFLRFYARLFRRGGLVLSKRVDELLELVGLTRQRRTRLQHFSKGMLQRIGIAQALINDPRLVLLDEPMSGLDPVGRREVRDIILQLRDQGKTVFFNSHTLPDVEMICDRVAILMEGRLLAMGPVRELVGSISVRSVEVELESVSSTEIAVVERMAEKVVVMKNYLIAVLPDMASVDEILRLANVHGWRLRAMTPRRASLEEIFLQEVSKHHHEIR